MNIIEDLTYRNLIYAITDEELKDKLIDDQLTFYLGADPTADSLHVGHLLAYLVAKRLAAYGHKPILLIGGATGLIGDPSGKSEERNLLTLEETMVNAKAIEKQVKNILPEATIVNNYHWMKNFDVIDFLRDVGKHFNLNQMLAKDSVKSRLESGISFTEFSYQIIQSIDFLELYKNKQCTLQIGGQEQWGNITAGLELIRKTLGSEHKAYGIVFPLITKKDGTKFGKTADGAVWLDPKKTSPYAFYQYWMNLDDSEALERLKQFTNFSKEDIDNIALKMQKTPHLRHAQKALGQHLTALVHGEAKLTQALKITEALFNNDIATLNAEEIEMAFEGVPVAKLKTNTDIVEALIASTLATSKREARTFIKQNAISLNGDKIQDENLMLNHKDALHQQYFVLRRGKKHYALIKFV